jgi:flagellar protein FliO/FliZ
MKVFLQLLWTILCVVVIIGLAYWVTKHLAANGKLYGFGNSRGENLTVLARLTLGKDQQLLVVQAGSRYFLLGVTAAQLTTLAEFTQQEAEVWQTEHDQPPGGETPSFGKTLFDQLRQKRWR